MFEGLRKPVDLIVIVVTLLSYGCPVQAIIHAFGLDERTVAAWRDRAGAEHLQALHQPVTRRAVSTLTEIPFHCFCTRPHIVRVLQQHKRRRSFEQEGELLSRVEAAREQIEQEGKPLTLTALVELVGVSPKVLRKYPRIRTLLDEVVLRSRRQRLAQRSACEKEYLANIAVVAAQLGASPEPLTQKALCRLAGIPLSCLSSSPRVKAKAKEVVLASRKTDQLHRTRQNQPQHSAENTVERNES